MTANRHDLDRLRPLTPEMRARIAAPVEGIAVGLHARFPDDPAPPSGAGCFRSQFDR